MARLILILFLCAFCIQAEAQPIPAAFEMEDTGATGYDTSIPTPEAVLGHVVGTRHTVPHQLVEYFQAVTAASDRVILREHARSYENRPLVHAIVTSPANHARLASLQEQNLRLSQEPDAITDAMLADMPVVLYQGYSIHGNEASGSEASLLYLYHLAAGQGPKIDEILEKSIIIVDPSFNPDGRDRFTDWANRNRGGVHTSDPQNREHMEAWPGGRTNHYLFDLNRDWLPAQHPESQGRLEVFYGWRPQVLTDHHEMGSESAFFFMPGIPSRNNPLTPQRNYELTAAMAEYHAKWLDKIGSLYYSKESFDDFYYGKGSSFPDGNGTIGILFEQASSRALERETSHGNLHYATTVRNQFSASLSTIESAIALKDELLKHQRDFYATASDVAEASEYSAFVVSMERDRTRAQVLAQMLQRHRINVHQLEQDLNRDGLTFKAGDAFVVPVDQLQARLVKSIFERITTFTDSLFYDVSTWTMPLAFDVDHAGIEGNARNLVGELMEPVTLDGGALVGGTSEYGYLMEWGRYFSPRALYRLQAAGFYPRLLHQEVEAKVAGQTRTFRRGTIFIPAVHRDPALRHLDAGLNDLIAEIVAKDHVQVYAVDSGLAVSGPDLGTRSATVLEKPRVALLTGSGSSSNNAGEVWHLLTERFEMPITLLDVDRLDGADLSRYNTMILSGGSYSGAPLDKIRSWIQSGGHLLTTSSGSDWAVRQGLLEMERKSFDLDSLLQDLPYDQLDEARGAQFIGGSIFEVDLDVTHPVAYGYRESVPFFRGSSTLYDVPEQVGVTVGRYSEQPLLSGYISEEKLEQVPGSAAIIARNMGRGSVVSFMDNPNFRAFWYGSNGLFMNAIFFGDAF